MGAKKKTKKAKKLEKGQRELLRDLRANRRRRDKLAARVGEERDLMSKLLVAGVAGGVAVAELAEQAGISRIHAHRLLSIAEAARASADQTGEPVDAAEASPEHDAAATDDGHPPETDVEPSDASASGTGARLTDESAPSSEHSTDESDE